MNGMCLERDHEGLDSPVTAAGTLKKGLRMAVFDGMGGENFGEYASFAAAQRMNRMDRTWKERLIPGKQYLSRLMDRLNDAVLEVGQELNAERMGTTAVFLYCTGRHIFSCNLGDSRAYRLRAGTFTQLSQDHTTFLHGSGRKKPFLTQYLGLDTQQFRLEPCIVREKWKKNDVYLLCSDGLTDMLEDREIADILTAMNSVQSGVQELMTAALNRGGRDNITAIVLKIG